MTSSAVDRAGEHAVVEMMEFYVVERPLFGLKRQSTTAADVTWGDVGASQEKGDGRVDGAVQYAIGSTILLPPLERTAVELFRNPALNDFAKVTYKRSIVQRGTTSASSPGLWLVDTASGEMLAQPKIAGQYTVNLIATDGGGSEVIVRTWSFDVLLKDTDVPEYGPNKLDCANGARVDDGHDFDQSYICNCDSGFDGPNCDHRIAPTECGDGEALVDSACRAFQLAVTQKRTNSGQEYSNLAPTEFYTVQEFSSYRIAPLAIDDTRTNYSSGNKSDVTYTMSGDTAGFFLNTDNGEMLGTFANYDDTKEETQTSSITLKAVDASGVQQVVETMVMNVRYPDLEVEEYGPNRQDCQNNGTRTDGLDGKGDRFDQSYLCKCASTELTTYSGDNCEIAETSEANAVTQATGSTGTTIGIMAAVVTVVALIGLVVYKRFMYMLQMKAFDFEENIQMLIANGTIDASDGRARGLPREVKRSNITMVMKIGEGTSNSPCCFFFLFFLPLLSSFFFFGLLAHFYF